MSGFVAAFAPVGCAPDDLVMRRLLDRLSVRGRDRSAVTRDQGAALGVARHAWEMVPGLSGGTMLASDERCVVAADASVYYHADLRRKLAAAGVHPAGDAPAHLILAAYRAWGPACASRIEGDFAFVVWDREARRVFCSRDFAGRRPLYYARIGATLVVASTIGTILEYPNCPRDLNLVSIAESASGFFGASHETCYTAISALPAGANLTWGNGGNGGNASEPVITRHWQPPIFDDPSATSFDDAADELRQLIADAVIERMAPSGPTAIFLSGGWDSPAVYAAGNDRLRATSSDRVLRPISVSYPPGDRGREDELIEQIIGHWQSPTRWIRSTELPIMDRVAERAAERDEPFGHVYEVFNRGLARGARAEGAHIALDGNGGDQLFSVTEVFLADLFRRGQWAQLAREWRAKNGTGFRNFFRWGIQPVLPPWALRCAAVLRRGRPLHGYLERLPPPWLKPAFLKSSGLVEREREFTPRNDRISRAAYEQYWYLATPIFPRILSAVFDVVLDEGVEMRSPLLDARIVEFAATRPREERSQGLETKRLLRHAVRGLLPSSVLAPRQFRTGRCDGYFSDGMKAHLPAMLDKWFRAPLLGELGIVDRDAFQKAAAQYMLGDDSVALALMLTLQTEMWLSAIHSGGVTGAEGTEVSRLDPGLDPVRCASC